MHYPYYSLVEITRIIFPYMIHIICMGEEGGGGIYRMSKYIMRLVMYMYAT